MSIEDPSYRTARAIEIDGDEPDLGEPPKPLTVAEAERRLAAAASLAAALKEPLAADAGEVKDVIDRSPGQVFVDALFSTLI